MLAARAKQLGQLFYHAMAATPEGQGDKMLHGVARWGFAGTGWNHDPGCAPARRPWALEYNARGVKKEMTQPRHGLAQRTAARQPGPFRRPDPAGLSAPGPNSGRRAGRLPFVNGRHGH